MRYLLKLLPFILLLIVSCGKGKNFCSIDDHLGTWKGTAACSGMEENATITIFQNTDGTILTRLSGIVLPTTLENCNISASGASGFGDNRTNYSVTGNIEEEQLVVTYTNSGVQNKTCSASLLKE